MTRFLLSMGMLLCVTLSYGQWAVDLQGGTSKADTYYGRISATYFATQGLRLGLDYHVGAYQYRFIDARQVEGAAVQIISLQAGIKIAENDFLRLDLMLKPGLRFQQAPPESALPNYPFDQNSTAFVFDPGLLVTLKASDKLTFHTGANFHTAVQLDPEPLFEQFPSSFILAGANYVLGDHISLFTSNMFGPASGAAGDSEKFFWQLRAGIRFAFGDTKDAVLLSNF
ncbi:MAG: hypothetical protein AAFQ83_17930 [Bacteroidota bacterium]